jgi:hypothetical protein
MVLADVTYILQPTATTISTVWAMLVPHCRSFIKCSADDLRDNMRAANTAHSCIGLCAQRQTSSCPMIREQQLPHATCYMNSDACRGAAEGKDEGGDGKHCSAQLYCY